MAHKASDCSVGPGTPQFSLTPYLVEAESSAPLAADWGRVHVPENRANPDSRTIEVPFVRFRSRADNPAPPVFFLDGGPGDIPSTLDCLEQLAPIIVEPFLDSADVILLEQRGVGHSRPSLDCPGVYRLPLDRPLDREAEVAAADSYFGGCARYWEDRGVDLAGYNVREMAADVDAVRQALGYEKITLFGSSFGSHHSIAVLRRFGEHIDRAVITSVEGPDHTIKLPGTVQRYLEMLNELVKGDPELSRQVPDFIGLVQTTLEGLENNPVTVEVTDPSAGKRVDLTVGKLDLQLLTSSAIGRIELRSLPARFYDMSKGDFSWLAEGALTYRTNFQANIMHHIVDCASGGTEGRRARVKREAGGTLLGDAINGVGPEICHVFGSPDLGDDFRGPLVSDVPMLLIGGSLDARTPVGNAEEVLRGLTNAQHMIVDGATHSMFQEAGSQIMPVIARFIKGDPLEPIESTRIAAPFEFDSVRSASSIG